MTPLWRRPFDAIERPLAAASESWVQTDTFMDVTARAIRLQRRLSGGVRNYGELWLHAFGMLSRQDAVELSKQVAGLERQVRELKRELEQRSEPAHEPGRHDGTRAGRAGSPKAV